MAVALANLKYRVLCAALLCAVMMAHPAYAFEKPTHTDKMRTQTPMSDMTEYFEKVLFRVPGKLADRVMTYFLYSPEKSSGTNSKLPLVVVLHGHPGNAYAAEHLISKDVSAEFPAYVMVPALPKGTLWASPYRRQAREKTQLANIVKMIQSASETHPIDTNRIYVMGCSEGSFGSFGAALYYPEIFAAAVPISGGWRVEDAKDMTKIPILSIHGALDESVSASFTREVSKMIHQYGGDISYKEFPDMEHECRSKKLYTHELWTWMFAQRKTATPPQ